MPDSKISALPSATVPLAGTEVLPIVQSSTTDKVTAADLLRQNGQTVTTSNPVLSLAQTWNAGGVTFTGLKFNATNTASAAGSLLLDLQTDGVTRFAVGHAAAAPYILTAAQAGTERFRVASQPSGASVEIYSGGTNSFLGFGTPGSTDTNLFRDAANTLALRNGVNAQTFRAYETYTDASNYARFGLQFSGSTWSLGSEAAGTGSGRSVAILCGGNLTFQGGGANQWQISGGNFLAVADNTRDIGASGANRPRNIYVADSVFSTYFRFPSSTRLQALSDGGLRISDNAISNFAILEAEAANTLALRNSTNAQAFRVYNTYTDASNYERLAAEWSGNTAYLRAQAAGTGSVRDLVLGNASATLTIYAGAPSSGMIHANRSTSSTNTAPFGVTGTLSASSALQYGTIIAPTFAQTSTAGYTALLVNATETTTGSGAKYLADFQVGGVSKFNVSSGGNGVFTGALTVGSATAFINTTTSLNNGAGVAAGTLTNAPAVGNPTKWIPINDNGTTRYIPAW